jgi:hypothetical protein
MCGPSGIKHKTGPVVKKKLFICAAKGTPGLVVVIVSAGG